MAGGRDGFDVYIEAGTRKTFAGALGWPGWSRSGKGEEAAVQALFDYGPRYAAALGGWRLGFVAPRSPAALRVVERHPGDATTDFGAPGKPPKADRRPVDDGELKRLQTLLRATWKALDTLAEGARGKALAKGPRGGGRDLDQIVRHVMEADAGYLYRIGVKHKVDDEGEEEAELSRLRKVILHSLTEAAHGEPVRAGPRGGVRWTPRWFVRRSAWHVLDHAWEIEDRVER